MYRYTMVGGMIIPWVKVQLLMVVIVCTSSFSYNTIRQPQSTIMEYFATTAFGLEKALAQEIKELPQASRIIINKGMLYRYYF